MSTLVIRRPSPHVAEVWLNRPEVRNAFNDGVIAELAQTFAELGRDEDLRVVVLGGHGKAFCAGADLSWMKQMAGYDWEQNRADARAPCDERPSLHGTVALKVIPVAFTRRSVRVKSAAVAE